MVCKSFAIINGAGSGTGSAVAQRFARSYTVVLFARQPANYQPIVDQIHAAGGSAFGYTVDASDPASVDAAFVQIEHDLGDANLVAVVYNANAGFAVKPFMELKLDDLDIGLGTAAGLFYFAQKTIPRLLDAVPSSPHPPSLIVTGATASVKGSARFSTFAAGKFAQRAITQSIAREFGPQGVHVSLLIIDGGIDTPRAKEFVVNGGVEDGKIAPEAIADSYWHLHTQPRSAFTFEADIRPFVEKW